MKRIAHRQTGPEVPEGLMRKCNQCGKAIIAEDAEQGYYICPKCGGYFHVPAYRRLDMILDEGSFQEWNETMPEQNPMEYRGYPEKLAAMKAILGIAYGAYGKHNAHIRVDTAQPADGLAQVFGTLVYGKLAFGKEPLGPLTAVVHYLARLVKYVHMVGAKRKDGCTRRLGAFGL